MTDRDAGVEERDVDAAQLAFDIRERGVDVVRLTDVGPMEDAPDRLGDRSTGVVGQVDDANTGAFCSQAFGRRLADARRSAGDERDLAVECRHDRRLRPRLGMAPEPGDEV